MSVLSLRSAAVLLVAGIGLGGCAYSPYGGIGVGIGYGDGYYDPYYDGGYYSPYGYYGSRYRYGSRYGYGYTPYWGWYDGFYYPGTGYYVYDRYRRPHRWSDDHRRYWERRRHEYSRGDSPTNRIIQRWGDFQNGGRTNREVIRQRSYSPSRTFGTREAVVRQQRLERRQERAEWRQERADSRRVFIEQRRQARTDRRRDRDD